MKKLVYTIAFDDRGQMEFRNLAKLLASSVVRSGFDGDVVVFHNNELPMFQLARTSVFEERIDLQNSDGSHVVDSAPEDRWQLKHQVAEILFEYDWDRALFIDADCVVVNSLDSIFEGDWEIGIYREPGQPVTNTQFNCFLTDYEMACLKQDGVNSGVLGVDRKVAKEFFEAWQAAESMDTIRPKCCLDQAALNRVVLDKPYSQKDFSEQISMPLYTDSSWIKRRNASIVHLVGAFPHEKLKYAFGLFMETYFFDPNLTLFNLLES